MQLENCRGSESFEEFREKVLVAVVIVEGSGTHG